MLKFLMALAFSGVLPVGTSDQDAAGHFSAWVEFPEQPVTIYGGSEDNVYRRNFLIQIPPGDLLKVWSFIGWDAGDHYEADLELVSLDEGIRIYQRSPHLSGDAWASEEVSYRCADPSGCYVEIILLGRVTDRNTSPQNPNFGELKGRLHFGLRLTMRELLYVVSEF